MLIPPYRVVLSINVVCERVEHNTQQTATLQAGYQTGVKKVTELRSRQEVVVHTFNPSTRRQRQVDL